MPQPAEARPAGISGKAIASFVCGLIGVFVLGVVLGAAALVLGYLGKRDTDATPGLGGRGLAIAGLVLGGIDVIFFFVVLSGGVRVPVQG